MSTSTRRRSWRTPLVLFAVAVVCVAAGWFARGGTARNEPQSVLSDADIAFAQQMSAHHQQALTMVDLLGPDAAREVRAVADQIRTSQWREIGTLTGWLELVGAPMQAVTETGGRHDHDGAHGAGEPNMAGMASDEELTRLHHATGAEREVLFLQLMIRHHQGGVAMASAAAQAGTTPAVRTRALSMVNGQQQEISSMVVLLDQRGAQVLPYP